MDKSNKGDAVYNDLQLFKTVVENVQHLVWVANADGYLTHLNEIWEKWTCNDDRKY